MSSFPRVVPTLNEPSISENRDGHASADAKPLRVSVNFSNGTRVLIPVKQDFTVSDLVTEAVRRAKALNLPCATDDVNLYSADGDILFGEDGLRDILFLEETPNLFLASQSPHFPVSPLTRPQNGSPAVAISHDQELASKLYVRWITPARAVQHSRLQALPPDKMVVSGNTTVSDLRARAFDRLNYYESHQMPSSMSVEIFLTSCHLSSNAGPVTLRDLNLQGTKDNPLDVYIVRVGTKGATPGRSDIDFGFTSTKRGKATFHTCLSVFLKRLADGNINLHNILAVLWEVTHFPPAVIALRTMHEKASKDPDPWCCAIFASAFHEMALKIVPPHLLANSDSALEASRQIFAWLQSLSSGPYELSDGSYLALTHKVGLKEINNEAQDSTLNQTGRFVHNERVEIYPESEGGSNSEQGSRKTILVSREKSDAVQSSFLAAAFWASYASPCNFYFNISPEVLQTNDHPLVALLHPQDFDNLIQITNEIGDFKMIGPLQLGQCTSATLPVITLDSEGYVSRYDQRDRECSDREFFTKNIFRTEPLSSSDPGQYLLQKLNPLVQKRKEEKSWEVDAWDDAAKTLDSRPPEEAVVICVDCSGSMSSEMPEAWMPKPPARGISVWNDSLSRLSEVKEIFKNLVSRISAYRLPTHVGLVTFSTAPKLEQQLTPVLYDFQNRLEKISAGGTTKLFDSLVTAKDMLQVFKKSYPGTKCRIIVLTDGLDNISENKPSDVCSDICRSGIVLDAIVIGTEETSALFKMAKFSGGYAFHPQSREMLFQTFLLDGFLDINARPDTPWIPLRNFNTSVPKQADMQTIFDFPPRKTQSWENESFFSLEGAHKHFTKMLNRLEKSDAASNTTVSSNAPKHTKSQKSGTTTLVSGAGGQGRVLLNELIAMMNNLHPSMDVYVSESNMGHWKVVMAGPSGTAYEKGIFVVLVDLGDQFPLRPPTIRFKTPILHPNVTRHGRICHAIFDREWHGGIHVFEVLRQIWGIMFSLEARDAVDPLFTLKFWTDPEGGRRQVEEFVDRFASQTRQQLREEILSSDSASVASSTTLTVDSTSDVLIKTPTGSSSSALSTTTNNTTSTGQRSGKRQSEGRNSILARLRPRHRE